MFFTLKRLPKCNKLGKWWPQNGWNSCHQTHMHYYVGKKSQACATASVTLVQKEILRSLITYFSRDKIYKLVMWENIKDTQDTQLI